MFGVGHPDVIGLFVAGAIVEVMLRSDRRDEGLHLIVVDQHLRRPLAAFECDQIAFVVDIAEPGAVRAPRDTVGRAGSLLQGVDLVDGHGLGWGIGSTARAERCAAERKHQGEWNQSQEWLRQEGFEPAVYRTWTVHYPPRY